MKTVLIGAGSDLGVHIDGAHLGPTQLLNDLKDFFQGEVISFIQKEEIIKSRNLSDKRKNEYEINDFSAKIYHKIVEKEQEGAFPILIGGDHSVAISSALASAKVHEDIGIIWFDAHPDFNTFDTTVTGNIHGLPLATITGVCKELRDFHDGKIIQPTKAVVVGARSIDDWEKDNIKYSGLTVFTTEDIKREGAKAITEKAFAIAGYKTNGIHISYDLDLLDPDVAPGVSIPEFEGITEEEGMEICDTILDNLDKVVSFDLVEFNPLRDRNRKTEQIAINILAKTIRKAEAKEKSNNKNLNSV